MTPLPKVIRKEGFELTLVSRKGKAAIYRQHWASGSPDNDADEVILPLLRKTNHLGQPVEPYETYPSSEEWGRRGWTLTTVARAQEKLEQIAKKGPGSGDRSRRNRFYAETVAETALQDALRALPAPTETHRPKYVPPVQPEPEKPDPEQGKADIEQITSVEGEDEEGDEMCDGLEPDGVSGLYWEPGLGNE
jgi:hypothetical protein